MPIRITLRQLEYFVTVGEEGSIALAAEKVNVSSPSISAAIGQMEREFGLQLFIRKHAQGLALTQAGRQFMQQAKVVLAAADQLDHLASDISGIVRGPLSVGCLLTFAQLMVPQLRRHFESRYREVRVSQSELNQQEIFNKIRSGDIDIALTYDLEIPDDLKFVPLAKLPPYLLVGDAHPLADRTSVSVQELADHPFVLLDLPISNSYFMSLFRAAGVKPQIAERTRDMAVMRSLVANGFGYSIANIRPLNDLSPDGKRLRHIPLSGSNRPMMMGLLMARGSENVLTVSAFVDLCRSLIAQDALPGIRPQKNAEP